MKQRYFSLLIIATLMTCAFVWVRLRIISTSYAINKLTKQEHLIREECSNLALRINKSKSPQRLESLALQKFKMKPPRVDQVVVLREK